MKTTPIGPFLGINNRLPDFALRKNTAQVSGNYLRTAENVDIDNARRVRRREVEVKIQAMTDGHSLHMTSDTTGYLMRGNSLYAITLPTYGQSFVKLLSNADPVSWVEVGDDLYFSNGTEAGRITAGLFFPMGLPTPTAPNCSVLPGSLYPGTYQVAVSYYNSVTKEEGGVSPSNNPVLGTAGGLQITLPSPTTGATHVNVYVSTVNGSVPLLVATVATGTATYDVTALAALSQGREASVRFEAPLPAGTLFMSNGKLCSFAGSMVYVGTPWRPGYYDIVAGWIPFPETVALAVENQGGTYIATTSKTHWFPGDLGEVKEIVRDPLPFGAVPGTAWRHPATTDCGWFSENGFIVANVQGEAVPVTFDVLDIGSVPTSGASNVRWTKGYVRVSSCGYCLNLENNHPTQYLDYDFNSFAGDYGVKADGLYNLTSSNGVTSRIGLGKLDFGTEELKHLPTIYLGVASEEPMEMQVVTPDQDYTYPARNSGADTRIQRVDVGKGLRANWFDLTVYNQSGSDFTLASVSFTPLASGRRI
jgi:hypothetical protein